MDELFECASATEKTLNLKTLEKYTKKEVKRLESVINGLTDYIYKLEREIEKLKRILH